jgi:hypothetical protein
MRKVDTEPSGLSTRYREFPHNYSKNEQFKPIPDRKLSWFGIPADSRVPPNSALSHLPAEQQTSLEISYAGVTFIRLIATKKTIYSAIDETPNTAIRCSHPLCKEAAAAKLNCLEGDVLG